MGGGFVLVLAAQQGDRVGAAVPFYGVGGYDQVDLAGVTAPVLGHFGSEDGFAPPEQVDALEAELQAKAKGPVEIVRYEGAGHAFFNDENLLGTYQPELAAQAWARTRGVPARERALSRAGAARGRARPLGHRGGRARPAASPTSTTPTTGSAGRTRPGSSGTRSSGAR